MLIEFARETFPRDGQLLFPGSLEPKPLKTHYIELRVSDSEGTFSPMASC